MGQIGASISAHRSLPSEFAMSMLNLLVSIEVFGSLGQ